MQHMAESTGARPKISSRHAGDIRFKMSHSDDESRQILCDKIENKNGFHSINGGNSSATYRNHYWGTNNGYYEKHVDESDEKEFLPVSGSSAVCQPTGHNISSNVDIVILPRVQNCNSSNTSGKKKYKILDEDNFSLDTKSLYPDAFDSGHMLGRCRRVESKSQMYPRDYGHFGSSIDSLEMDMILFDVSDGSSSTSDTYEVYDKQPTTKQINSTEKNGLNKYTVTGGNFLPKSSAKLIRPRLRQDIQRVKIDSSDSEANEEEAYRAERLRRRRTRHASESRGTVGSYDTWASQRLKSQRQGYKIPSRSGKWLSENSSDPWQKVKDENGYINGFSGLAGKPVDSQKASFNYLRNRHSSEGVSLDEQAGVISTESKSKKSKSGLHGSSIDPKVGNTFKAGCFCSGLRNVGSDSVFDSEELKSGVDGCDLCCTQYKSNSTSDSKHSDHHVLHSSDDYFKMFSNTENISENRPVTGYIPTAHSFRDGTPLSGVSSKRRISSEPVSKSWRRFLPVALSSSPETNSRLGNTESHIGQNNGVISEVVGVGENSLSKSADKARSELDGFVPEAACLTKQTTEQVSTSSTSASRQRAGWLYGDRVPWEGEAESSRGWNQSANLCEISDATGSVSTRTNRSWPVDKNTGELRRFSAGDQMSNQRSLGSVQKRTAKMSEHNVAADTSTDDEGKNDNDADDNEEELGEIPEFCLSTCSSMCSCGESSDPENHPNRVIIAPEDFINADIHTDSFDDLSSDDADDEFECDCSLCTAHRHYISENWVTSDRLNTWLSASQENNQPETLNDVVESLALPDSFSFSFNEPDYLTLLQDYGDRQILDSMFQDVISQMLAVYPDLLANHAPPALTEDQFEALPVTVVQQQDLNEEFSCSICLCPFEVEEELKNLPCSHSFHTACVKIWLTKTCTCPVCRDRVTRDDSATVEQSVGEQQEEQDSANES